MVVRLRLARLGCRNRPFYRVMAADSRSPRDGKHIEVLGYYNPLPDQQLHVRVCTNNVKKSVPFVFDWIVDRAFEHNLMSFRVANALVPL
ncbi:30S ribosomal protein S16-2, chloroplastic/mitochondrial [Tanacetum coccineum]